MRFFLTSLMKPLDLSRTKIWFSGWEMSGPLGHVRLHLIFVCQVNALFFGDETLTNNLVLRSSPRKLLILLEATPGIEPG